MVVWTFDSDVFDLPSLVRIRGAAGAKLGFEQRLDLLQAPAFCLRQAAIDEDETQQSQAGVEEESSWGDETQEHTRSLRTAARKHKEHAAMNFSRAASLFRNKFRLFSFIVRIRNTGGDSRSWGKLILDVDWPRNVYGEVCALTSENGINSRVNRRRRYYTDTQRPLETSIHTETHWQRLNEISWPLWSLFSPCQSIVTFVSPALHYAKNHYHFYDIIMFSVLGERFFATGRTDEWLKSVT